MSMLQIQQSVSVSAENLAESPSSSRQLMEQAPGVTFIEDGDQSCMVREVAGQLSGHQGAGYPGTTPRCLRVQDLPTVTKEPYGVTWKSDGVRFLMLIAQAGEIYLLDERNNAFSVANISFPFRKIPRKHLFCTLLDGDTVLDREGGKVYPHFLVRDIALFRIDKVRLMSFDIRKLCIEKEIIGARRQLILDGQTKVVDELFEIAKKHTLGIDMSEKLLGAKFRSQVPHGILGIKLQPIRMAYTPGVRPGLLEWRSCKWTDQQSGSVPTEDDLLGFIRSKYGGTGEKPASAVEQASPNRKAGTTSAIATESIGSKRFREDREPGSCTAPKKQKVPSERNPVD